MEKIQKRKVLKEVLFDDVEETMIYNFDWQTSTDRDRDFYVSTWYRGVGKIPTRPKRI